MILKSSRRMPKDAQGPKTCSRVSQNLQWLHDTRQPLESPCAAGYPKLWPQRTLNKETQRLYWLRLWFRQIPNEKSWNKNHQTSSHILRSWPKIFNRHHRPLSCFQIGIPLFDLAERRLTVDCRHPEASGSVRSASFDTRSFPKKTGSDSLRGPCLSLLTFCSFHAFLLKLLGCQQHFLHEGLLRNCFKHALTNRRKINAAGLHHFDRSW
jgi:hypothetical protein